jgi:hypothetical protein
MIRLATYFLLGLTLALLIATCMGCVYNDARTGEDCARHGLFQCKGDHPEVTKEQSWDQENLKRHDAGCPTAIYDAPGGNLRQCQ